MEATDDVFSGALWVHDWVQLGLRKTVENCVKQHRINGVSLGSGPGGRWFKSTRPDHFQISIYHRFTRSFLPGLLSSFVDPLWTNLGKAPADRERKCETDRDLNFRFCTPAERLLYFKNRCPLHHFKSQAYGAKDLLAAPGGRLPVRPHRIAVGPIHFNEKPTFQPSGPPASLSRRESATGELPSQFRQQR